jgi:hypothetical protein
VSSDGITRRNWLGGAGAVPLLAVPGNPQVTGPVEAVFTPIELGRFFNAWAAQFGPREPLRPRVRDGLIRTPGGRQQFRGIPFLMGPGGVERKSWVALRTRDASWTSRSAEIPIGRTARYACVKVGDAKAGDGIEG